MSLESSKHSYYSSSLGRSTPSHSRWRDVSYHSPVSKSGNLFISSHALSGLDKSSVYAPSPLSSMSLYLPPRTPTPSQPHRSTRPSEFSYYSESPKPHLSPAMSKRNAIIGTLTRTSHDLSHQHFLSQDAVSLITGTDNSFSSRSNYPYSTFKPHRTVSRSLTTDFGSSLSLLGSSGSNYSNVPNYTSKNTTFRPIVIERPSVTKFIPRSRDERAKLPSRAIRRDRPLIKFLEREDLNPSKVRHLLNAWARGKNLEDEALEDKLDTRNKKDSVCSNDSGIGSFRGSRRSRQKSSDFGIENCDGEDNKPNRHSDKKLKVLGDVSPSLIDDEGVHLETDETSSSFAVAADNRKEIFKSDKYCSEDIPHSKRRVRINAEKFVVSFDVKEGCENPDVNNNILNSWNLNHQNKNLTDSDIGLDRETKRPDMLVEKELFNGNSRDNINEAHCVLNTTDFDVIKDPISEDDKVEICEKTDGVAKIKCEKLLIGEQREDVEVVGSTISDHSRHADLSIVEDIKTKQSEAKDRDAVLEKSEHCETSNVPTLSKLHLQGRSNIHQSPSQTCDKNKDKASKQEEEHKVLKPIKKEKIMNIENEVSAKESFLEIEMGQKKSTGLQITGREINASCSQSQHDFASSKSKMISRKEIKDISQVTKICKEDSYATLKKEDSSAILKKESNCVKNKQETICDKTVIKIVGIGKKKKVIGNETGRKSVNNSSENTIDSEKLTHDRIVKQGHKVCPQEASVDNKATIIPLNYPNQEKEPCSSIKNILKLRQNIEEKKVEMIEKAEPVSNITSDIKPMNEPNEERTKYTPLKDKKLEHNEEKKTPIKSSIEKMDAVTSGISKDKRSVLKSCSTSTVPILSSPSVEKSGTKLSNGSIVSHQSDKKLEKSSSEGIVSDRKDDFLDLYKTINTLKPPVKEWKVLGKPKVLDAIFKENDNLVYSKEMVTEVDVTKFSKNSTSSLGIIRSTTTGFQDRKAEDSLPKLQKSSTTDCYDVKKQFGKSNAMEIDKKLISLSKSTAKKIGKESMRKDKLKTNDLTETTVTNVSSSDKKIDASKDSMTQAKLQNVSETILGEVQSVEDASSNNNATPTKIVYESLGMCQETFLKLDSGSTKKLKNELSAESSHSNNNKTACTPKSIDMLQQKDSLTNVAKRETELPKATKREKTVMKSNVQKSVSSGEVDTLSAHKNQQVSTENSTGIKRIKSIKYDKKFILLKEKIATTTIAGVSKANVTAFHEGEQDLSENKLSAQVLSIKNETRKSGKCETPFGAYVIHTGNMECRVGTYDRFEVAKNTQTASNVDDENFLNTRESTFEVTEIFENIATVGSQVLFDTIQTKQCGKKETNEDELQTRPDCRKQNMDDKKKNFLQVTEKITGASQHLQNNKVIEARVEANAVAKKLMNMDTLTTTEINAPSESRVNAGSIDTSSTVTSFENAAPKIKVANTFQGTTELQREGIVATEKSQSNNNVASSPASKSSDTSKDQLNNRQTEAPLISDPHTATKLNKHQFILDTLEIKEGPLEGSGASLTKVLNGNSSTTPVKYPQGDPIENKAAVKKKKPKTEGDEAGKPKKKKKKKFESSEEVKISAVADVLTTVKERPGDLSITPSGKYTDVLTVALHENANVEHSAPSLQKNADCSRVTENLRHKTDARKDLQNVPSTELDDLWFDYNDLTEKLVKPGLKVHEQPLRNTKLTIEKFHFLKVLGRGSYGKVMLAELKGHSQYFAIKCLKKDVVLEDNDVECTMIEREVLAMGTSHPYLCTLYCTFQNESHLFFVMEYLSGGDLMFHIQQSGRFDQDRARFYAAEIVCALKYLHKHGIIYRDAKLDNICIDSDGHVRLVDFGFCKLRIYRKECLPRNLCGTPDYMAPEILKGCHYNQSVDWWSFGVLLYEMLIGQSPFNGSNEEELFWSVCNEEVFYPRFISKEAKMLLTLLLEKEPEKRLGMPGCDAGDIYYQSFFRYTDWNKIERKEVDPPFKPKLKSETDVSNFDSDFTMEAAALTPTDKESLKSLDQEQFTGFTYTNPDMFSWA